jgi:SAM-dependent methyltransferase
MSDVYIKSPIKTVNGIADFSNDDFYWGIIPKEEMHKFNMLARKLGYEKAKKDFKFSLRFDYAESYGRADFHFLLPLGSSAHVLDVGSGFGNVTIPLSRFYSKITAVDASLPLLEFSKIRADSLGIRNIDFVHVDSLDKCNLPFNEKSFDAIILNGVLEWVGTSAGAGTSPRDIQIQFLTQLKKLLKDGGVLYVGIENRLFPGWIKRDPHSKLKWTSIMPRYIANWYARQKGLDGYKTYIYSIFGYKKLLKKAGLSLNKVYSPYRSYREPDFIFGNEVEVKGYLFKRNFISQILTRKWVFFEKCLQLINMEAWFLSSFIFLVSRGKSAVGIPYILSYLNGKVEQLKVDDVVLKMKGEGDKAAFLLFHKGQTKPYMKVFVSRLNESHVVEMCNIPE